ncbi:hypothetical protein ACPCBC_10105 [Streptomyces incarnatus]
MPFAQRDLLRWILAVHLIVTLEYVHPVADLAVVAAGAMTARFPFDSGDDPTGATPPVPAPFMFTCTGCWHLLILPAKKVRADAGCFDQQIDLSRHIATEHPDEVPPPHGNDCPLCPEYAELPDCADTWAEHRARVLFLPKGVARLL